MTHFGFKTGVILSLFLSISCGQKRKDRAEPAFPLRVLLITIDTLRADHLGCYGYQKIETARINRLARDGVLFKNAFSPVPLTLPAHCSIFTGSYPIVHGVRDQAGFSLAPGSETLASKLKRQGMATAAFVGSFVLDSRFGVGQGFDHYFDRFDSTSLKSGTPDTLERRGEVVAQEAMRWMEQPREQGFFAWLHFYDPHTPYMPPEPFHSQYPHNPYDGEIAYTDSVVGMVVDFLVRKEWYQDALVVLTSDHGEDLGEHGENTHGYFLYDSTVRVPLLLKLPRGRHAGKTVENPVELIDLMPTILEVTAAPSGSNGQGKSLLPLLSSTTTESTHEVFGETFYPYYHFGWSPLQYIRTGKFKYILAPSPELYDVEKDPGEQINLFSENRAVADQLRDRLLVGYMQLASARPERKEENAEVAKKLKSLGYVTASSRASRRGVDKNLPDPKDKLPLYRLLLAAQLDSQNGKLDSAVQKFKAALAEDPGLTDAHVNLGLIYSRTGNYLMAIEQFRKALEADGSNVIATYNLAHSYAQADKLQEAIVGFERTLALDPKEARAHVGLGIAYQMQGKLDRALEEYQRALQLDPDDSTAYNNIASIYLSRRDVDSAMSALRQSLNINGFNPETHNLMGSAFWLKNDAEAAISEFREAIRLDKNYVDPYLNLGMLLASQDRIQESLSFSKTAARLAPRSARAHQILGQTYLAAGMKAEAAQALARAKRLSKP